MVAGVRLVVTRAQVARVVVTRAGGAGARVVVTRTPVVVPEHGRLAVAAG
ncbi:hypothetical protein [Propionicimonas sp. T2.31MG-18]